MNGSRRPSSVPRGLALVLASCLLLVQSLASAAPTSTGFALDRYQPAEAGSDWFQAESLDLRGKVRPGLGLVGNYSYRPLVLLDSAGEEVTPIVRYQFFYHLDANVVLYERLRLAASLPVVLYSLGGQGLLEQAAGVPNVAVRSSSGSGVGDARFAADLRILGQYGGPFTLAAGARVFAAIGQETKFTSDGLARVAGRVMAAGKLGRFTYATEVGLLWHAERDDFVGQPFGTDLTFGAAAGLSWMDGIIHLGPELVGSTVVSDSGAGFLKGPSTPIELDFGAKFLVAGAIRLGAAVGTGLTSGFGTSKLRLLASLEWLLPLPRQQEPEALPPPSRDLDGDGVLDESDVCVGVSGPARPLEPARNGCPDPLDSDGDRIGDELDACPHEAGAASANPALHGCVPSPDTDGDGVADNLDACPSVRGILQAESGLSGCPVDSDRDGVADAFDGCPSLAGEDTATAMLRGCPKARLEQDWIVLNEPVRFTPAGTRILTESEGVLTAVVELLVQHPEIERLNVEGHTDKSGSARANLKLSRERAGSVVAWLVRHGISARRLTSEGFGSSVPVDTNDTEQGRANNRRLELRIMRRGVRKDAPRPAPGH